MLHTTRTLVKRQDPLFAYCDCVCHLANNLYNACTFLVRQCMTGLKKPPELRTGNEREALASIETALPGMNAGGKPHNGKKKREYTMPTADKWFLNSSFLCAYLKAIEHFDYTAPGIGSQTAQQTVLEVVEAWQSYFTALRLHKMGGLSDLPKPPGYRKKGGLSTATLTNQECKLRERGGSVLLKLPKLDDYGLKGRRDKTTGRLVNDAWLEVSPLCKGGDLREVRVVPSHGSFEVQVTFGDGLEAPGPCDPADATRIAAVDLGVENLAAVANNVGAECLLVKGGSLLSLLRWREKEVGRIKSEQLKGKDGGKVKFSMTARAHDVYAKSERQVRDLVSKDAKLIVDHLVENGIQLVVVGKNDGWKQGVAQRPEGEAVYGWERRNNQKLCQMPHGALVKQLQWRCEREGIAVVVREESYTSKASFLDNDPMPTYGREKEFVETHGAIRFSGERFQRGLYRTSDGRIVNADLQAAANLLRKERPDAFELPGASMPLFFEPPVIVKHPDLEERARNRTAQREAPRAKQRGATLRLRRQPRAVPPCATYDPGARKRNPEDGIGPSGSASKAA